MAPGFPKYERRLLPLSVGAGVELSDAEGVGVALGPEPPIIDTKAYVIPMRTTAPMTMYINLREEPPEALGMTIVGAEGALGVKIGAGGDGIDGTEGADGVACRIPVGDCPTLILPISADIVRSSAEYPSFWPAGGGAIGAGAEITGLGAVGVGAGCGGRGTAGIGATGASFGAGGGLIG